MIELAAGRARATILPGKGAGLAGLWFDGLPALTLAPSPREAATTGLAMFPLAPFSNRISGGFRFRGRHHDLLPNREGEPFPIHGDAFQRPWRVTDSGTGHATLMLEDGAFGPWRYRAELRYRLSATELETRLALTSTATAALPYGAGFHPWFPRTPDTRLGFRAKGAWPENARHLPDTLAPVALPEVGPGNGGSELPEGAINQGFAGWDGNARITQGPGAASLHVATEGLGTVILYSPGRDAGFFCFEPVTHPVDAHNLPGRPGLVVLAPGESMTVSMTLAAG